MFARHLPRVAMALALIKLGRDIAEIIPMTATTIIISASVKALEELVDFVSIKSFDIIFS